MAVPDECCQTCAFFRILWDGTREERRWAGCCCRDLKPWWRADETLGFAAEHQRLAGDHACGLYERLEGC